MIWFAVTLLILVLLAGWLATVVGLPGTWLILFAVALYAAGVSPEAPATISWSVVIVLAALAVVGEILEFIAGAMGAARRGSSFRGAAMALLGSAVGGIAGLFVGLPIPVLGSLAAGLLFASVGALVGAVLGEMSLGRDWNSSLDVGQAAFWGRLLGTLAKVVVGSVMVVIALVALVA